MVEHSKRKKHHDKDKYYRLAKEQGLRSRAAFKLTQINRQHSFLEKAVGVLDLCAAPGGWTQIASRTCPKNIPIVAVDILPIRPLPNVTTLIGDITTDKCQAEIRKTLQGTPVNVVLHDGAPNVGAEYGKDAYEQNELALAALKCATQHLKAGGIFLTKVYRSRDYAAVQWVLQQLFDQLHVIKPSASRSQSAEIFFLAMHYKAPKKLDPRLLDPKHVFAETAGATTGGTLLPANAGLNVLDKTWNQTRRKRGGYDMEHLDATMRHYESVQHFVTMPSLKAAVDLLSQSTGLTFTCPECKDKKSAAPKDHKNKKNKQQSVEDAPTCACAFLLHHPFTTQEMKESVADLQVLNQSDFKRLLTWRTQLQDALKARQEAANEDTDGVDKKEIDDDDDEEASDKGKSSDQEDADEDDDNPEQIQQEIAAVRARRAREKKRLERKERAAAAKRRKKAAMDVMTLDVDDQDQIFSLSTLKNAHDLDLVSEHVNLDQMTDEQIFGAVDSDEDDDAAAKKKKQQLDEEEEEKLRVKREMELDEAYQQYLENTKDGLAKSGTKMAKRSKKLQQQKLMEEAAEDQEMTLLNMPDYNARTYAELLQGPKDSDDDDDDDDSSKDDEENDDDGYNAEPMTPEEHAAAKRNKVKETTKKQASNKNPLLHEFPDNEPTSMKTARWFSNPLFATIGKAAEEAVTTTTKKKKQTNDDDDDSSSDDSDEENNRRHKKKPKVGLDADEVLASMPKTDKQIRHERRIKAMAREERRKARKARLLGEKEDALQVVPGDRNDDDSDNSDQEDADLSHLSDAQKKKILEARELIKAGIGKVTDDNKALEIVPADDGRPLPKLDDRDYNEDGYDSDEYAQTLALGTMMLRKSKERALVDASYNRYAWNDPADLPEWFVDDENKHYRPQLPIPPALLAKMKEKMMALSAKPIKKVAEARARKSKRAKMKLAAARKQAAAVSNNTDMSESMKLKAISKALRSQEAKKPGKTYVVAKKGRNQGAKGVKLVDKRMKSDQRGLDRKEKKRKRGKR